MDEASRREAKAWLARAFDDLGSARKLLETPNPFPATAAYHCQQAAEKALKAYLAAINKSIPRSHDLRLLVEICVAHDPGVGLDIVAAEYLTPFATEFRYPSGSPDPDIADVEFAIALASRIFSAIETAVASI